MIEDINPETAALGETDTPLIANIEYEFGIPIPGEILAPDRWAKTALKKLPEQWDEQFIFGRSAPLILDIGCGNGRSTLSLALEHPESNVLGIDVLPVVIRYATRRGNQRGLSNLKFAVIGGKEIFRQYPQREQYAEVHCYHPQPYYTKREISKRLISPDFLEMVFHALKPGGKFVIQTDHPAYWEYMCATFPALFEWQPHHGPWPDAPQGRTRREIIAMSRGLPIFRGVAIPRKELTAEEIQHRLKNLPWPRFNADRRIQELDRIEQDLKNNAPQTSDDKISAQKSAHHKRRPQSRRRR
jgi:tRNA (guanine-N7-)-methyltransferase